MAFAIILGIVFSAMIIAGVALLIIGIVGNSSYSDEKSGSTKIFAGILLGLAGIALVSTVPGSIHQVDTGEVAVVRHLGKIEGTRDPGIYWDFSWVKSYEKYDTKVQQLDIDSSTYSKDNQTIDVSVEIQYAIDAANADRIAAEYGSLDKLESKIKAIATDNIKSVFAKNTATDVISNRAQISAEITNTVSTSVNTNYYVDIKTVVMTNIEFTDDFEAAVAAKVAEEQKKQQADIENEAAIAKAEAEAAAAKAKAEGEAEVAKIKAEADAEVARIQAEADAEVAKIQADAAEYQGKKDAAIMMNKLASVNGWYVMTVYDTDNVTVVGYKLMTGLGNPVTQAELEVGVQRLIQVLIAEKWDGQLPTYMMSDSGVITVVLGDTSSSGTSSGTGTGTGTGTGA